MKNFLLSLLCGLCLIILGCGKEPAPDTRNQQQSAEVPFPVPNDPQLVKGREVWMNTCKNCHAYGLAGAPKAGDKEAWKARIEKGEKVLFAHAINGFLGPSGTEMPAKGGEESLSDDQVKQAVLYMISISQ